MPALRSTANRLFSGVKPRWFCHMLAHSKLPGTGGRTAMVTRAPFLKTRFGGYHHRVVPDEDAELTHVGPETPCGEYLRRFWQPVCFSDELQDLPLRVKVLGEDLVAYRDKSGTIGLL